MIDWVAMLLRVHFDAPKSEFENGSVTFLQGDVAAEPVEGLSAH